MKTAKHILVIIFFSFKVLSSIGQSENNAVYRDTGFIIFYDENVVFIPSVDVKADQFLKNYVGDTGYRIGNNEFLSKLKLSSTKYEGVTNYLINDSLMPETKIISLIPVEIKYFISPSVLKWEITDILWRYQNKDYIFKYQTFSYRNIELILLRR